MRFASVLVAAIVSSAPTVASADVFKLYAEGHAGGTVGKGTGGDLVDNANGIDAAFFEKAPHVTYGALVGARFLFLDAQIQHHQLTDGDRIATWTQFAAGLDFELGLGEQTPAQKKSGKGSYLGVGVHVGFGLGTGQQVSPPLSNDEITDKGFLVEGKLGFGKHLNKVFDIGVVVPVSYGYFFKNTGGAVANDVSTHYQSVQAAALLVLRANIRL